MIKCPNCNHVFATPRAVKGESLDQRIKRFTLNLRPGAKPLQEPCLIWFGSFAGEYPVLWWEGRTTLVRSLLHPTDDRHATVMLCGRNDCVERSHITVKSKSEIRMAVNNND